MKVAFRQKAPRAPRATASRAVLSIVAVVAVVPRAEHSLAEDVNPWIANRTIIGAGHIAMPVDLARRIREIRIPNSAIPPL